MPILIYLFDKLLDYVYLVCHEVCVWYDGGENWFWYN